MKKRDVILDFTSLLDVTLIVIFFFVLFSHLDGQVNKLKTEKKIQELETAIQKAEAREADADELVIQFDKELSIVRDNSERQASNILEFINYNRNKNLKIILDMNQNNWSLRVIKEEKVIDVINNNDNMAEVLKKALINVGYDNSKTIFCDFVFDGSLSGTASAYRKIKSVIADIAKEYHYLYISETDLSIGR